MDGNLDKDIGAFGGLFINLIAEMRVILLSYIWRYVFC